MPTEELGKPAIPSHTAALPPWEAERGTLRAPKVVGTPHSHHSNPLGAQVQVLQDPLVQQTPLGSHTAY